MRVFLLIGAGALALTLHYHRRYDRSQQKLEQAHVTFWRTIRGQCPAGGQA